MITYTKLTLGKTHLSPLSVLKISISFFFSFFFVFVHKYVPLDRLLGRSLYAFIHQKSQSVLITEIELVHSSTLPSLVPFEIPLVELTK